MMAALDEAFLRASSTFKIPGFNSYQKLATETFVIQKPDVLVNLPTGSGKSLIYQALPIVFDSIFKEQGHIVVVVSPLIRLAEECLPDRSNLLMLSSRFPIIIDVEFSEYDSR